MKTLLTIVLLTSSGALFAGCPGGNCPQIPQTNGTNSIGYNTNQLGSTAQSSNAGNNQNITFGGAQAQKPIGNVGTTFLTTSNDTCVGSIGGGGSGPLIGLNAATTYQITSCHLRAQALTSRALGDNSSYPIDLVQCTDPTSYELRISMGKPCPIRPSAQGLATIAMPGGLVANVAEKNPYYRMPPAVVAAPVVIPQNDYVTRPELNRKLDNLHKKQLLK